MNNNFNGTSFVAGIILGMFLLLLLLIASENTPIYQQQRNRQTAVDKGHAQWIATTNGQVQFMWNTNGCHISNK